MSEVLNWQGHQGSNPGPAVLETAALPTELYPFTATFQLFFARSTYKKLDLIRASYGDTEPV